MIAESESVLREHAYLVARGVRPMALVGHQVNVDDLDLLRLSSTLERHSELGAIAFVRRGQSGIVDYGYAARAWVVDLYGWLINATEDEVPAIHRDRILGVLLGYNSAAIQAFEEQSVGRVTPKRVTG